MSRHDPAPDPQPLERRIFWMVVAGLGLIAVVLLPLWWGLASAVPIALIAWWVAYQSGWFRPRTPGESPVSSSRQTHRKHAA